MVLIFFVAGIIYCLQLRQLPATDISNYEGRHLTIVGIINDVPQVTLLDSENARIRYKLAVQTIIDENDKPIRVTGGVIVNSYQSVATHIMSYGTEVAVRGKVSIPNSYGNPGMIDTRAALRRDGVTARLTVSDGMSELSNTSDKWYWQNTLAKWRENIDTRMKNTMSKETAAILIGSLFGGYTGISKDVISSFATTGIIHILSVSGTHISLVVTVMWWLGSLFRLRSFIIALLAIVAIVVYALISGCTPPVVRSTVMGVIALLAIGFGRENDAPTALMVAAFLMLLYQPDIVYDISFQLSFFATAGLIFLYPPIVFYLKPYIGWLAEPLAVTLAAQLGVLPFIAWYFKSFSMSAFIANLIVVPLIEAAVVIGLFIAVIGAFIEPVNLLWTVCDVIIDAVVILTKMFAAIPGASIYIPPFGFWEALIYYMLVAWFFGYCPSYIPSPTVVFNRYFKVVVVSIMILAVGFSIYINCPSPFVVHFIDVGQGDATLIITPRKRAILIDTGGNLNESTDFDIGERVVLPYLKHYGILDIDYLILTHGHQDHAGGAAAIVSSIPVKNTLIVREKFTPALERVINISAGSTFVPLYNNQKIMLDETVIEVVYDGTRIDRKENRPGNESSAVVKVTYGRYSFLITGDLAARGEQAILAKGTPINSTVLKVAHHGSNTSTTPEFLSAVKPQYAVISVGHNNRYGHPHPEVLQRLKQENIPIYRTDINGAIKFEVNQESLKVITYRN